ncbi:MAG: integral rane sensor signal transduction histidine kinase [Rickettsiaceae bacterium]|jgi:signal transduction histidine kinase|nr:integral rane sensor signal transduction histidine kinase [Rickettsiaceae bacterium]
MFRLMTRSKSLTSRITTLSFLGISIAIIIAGYFITWSFNNAMQKSVRSNIAAYVDIFIAATSIDENGNVKISDETDLLQNIPRYWQISSEGKFLKKSALLKEWVNVEQSEDSKFIRFTDSDGTNIVAIQKTVFFPGNKPVIYLFGIQAEIAKALRQEQRMGFFQDLISSLVLLTVILVVLTYFQVRLTISPLAQIKQSLARIKSGEEIRLQESFPREIKPLTDEINNLLDYGASVVGRHRSFASNMSHSLKTPLSVLHNEAQKTKGVLAAKVIETTATMLSIIDRNLARSKIAGAANILGARTEVLPLINKISNSFAKLYKREVTINCTENIFFRGDEGDLFEVLGNLIENACKYAKSQIKVSAEVNSNLVIIIEDDGKGIPENQRQRVLERGVRLDEAVPGTGIGLPIAKDIVELYNGSISLEGSELGGLKVVIILPAIA